MSPAKVGESYVVKAWDYDDRYLTMRYGGLHFESPCWVARSEATEYHDRHDAVRAIRSHRLAARPVRIRRKAGARAHVEALVHALSAVLDACCCHPVNGNEELWSGSEAALEAGKAWLAAHPASGVKVNP